MTKLLLAVLVVLALAGATKKATPTPIPSESSSPTPSPDQSLNPSPSPTAEPSVEDREQLCPPGCTPRFLPEGRPVAGKDDGAEHQQR